MNKISLLFAGLILCFSSVLNAETGQGGVSPKILDTNGIDGIVDIDSPVTAQKDDSLHNNKIIYIASKNNNNYLAITDETGSFTQKISPLYTMINSVAVCLHNGHIAYATRNQQMKSRSFIKYGIHAKSKSLEAKMAPEDFSNDCNTLLYTSADKKSYLYSYDMQTGKSSLLLKKPVVSARWSADNNLIVLWVMVGVDGRGDLFLLSYPDLTLKRLTETRQTQEIYPSFLTKNEVIYATDKKGLGKWQLDSINIKTGEIKATGIKGNHPSVLQSPNKIVYEYGGDIHIHNFDNSSDVVLITGERPVVFPVNAKAFGGDDNTIKKPNDNGFQESNIISVQNKAKGLLQKGRELWKQGQLQKAITEVTKAQEIINNKEINKILESMQKQKDLLDGRLQQASDLIKQSKFKEAAKVLPRAAIINDKYSKYQDVLQELISKKYPSRAIFDGKSFGNQWKPCEIDGKFSKYAKFENDKLWVNYPKNYGWGRIGVESNDTIVGLNKNLSLVSQHLNFKFDPRYTTGFEIALEGINVKSQSYSTITIVYRHTNENESILELHKDGSLQGKINIGKKSPESLNLTILPNNFAYLTLPDGRYLQTHSVKYPMPEKGYKLKVYARAGRYKEAANMALESINLRKIPVHDSRQNTTIFDGKYLAGNWEPYVKGGNFSEHARFEKNELIIDVPKGHGWGEVGIWSIKPIIDFITTKQSSSFRLKFDFDTENTENFSIMIEGLVHLDYKRKDNKTASIELWSIGGYDYMYGKLDLGSVVPKYVEIVMHPSNVMQIKLPDGRSMQTVVSDYMTTRKHKLGVYSEAREKNLPAKMALKSITLKKVPFTTSSHLSNLKESDKKVVLFDGKLGDIWIPYNEQYQNYYGEYAHFSKHQLFIDIPKEHKWGEAGILSPKPLVWLDRLGIDGEFKMTFSFDPQETTGFSIIVADGFNSTWETPWGEDISLTWSKVEDNDISKLRIKFKNELLLDENLTSQAPSNITLSFKNKEIGIEGDTFSKKTFKWSHLVENRALYFWVFSHAYKKNLPVKMALKKIVLKREFGKPLPVPKPAKGVSPLPVKVIYGNGVRNKWECFKIEKKNKESHCASSKFVITIPKGGESIQGMRSKDKIITLDERRINETSLKMILYFNPKKTDSFYIGLDEYYVTLVKKDKKTYLFQWGDKWSREVDAKWLNDEWNGKVNIVMSKNWTKVGLDNGTAIHSDDRMSRTPSLSILAVAPKTKMKYGGSLELKKITTEWVIPDGMTAIDRWELIDDEDFDPDAFLKEIREGR